MLKQIAEITGEYEGLQKELSNPDIVTNPSELKRVGKRISEIEKIMPTIKEYKKCQSSIDDVESMKEDPDLLKLAEEDANKARKRMPELEEEIKVFLIPRDPNDERSVILEVRAGTGGEEAALFAAELLRMYMKYAEDKGWTPELFDKKDAEAGGIKEAVVKIDGDEVYGHLKFESGVHRVQRVPSTESQGRLHTSAASVAIMPEAEEVDINIKPEDMKVDVFRSSGPGGQSVNTTDSAVRLTYLPTNTVVICQDEKSQLKNKNKAMSILRSRLYAEEQERLAKERGDMRAGQIGSGDRSEKIRTYNYPQDRVTDHRIKVNFSNLPGVLAGDLGEIVEKLRESDRESRLNN